MQTRDILDTIFKNLIGRADMRDLYSLADPAACKEYIVMTEAALKKLFKKFRITRNPDGELLIQSIKGFQSASNPERGEQEKRCKELAFYFIKIFQIYAALTISIIDSKMPESDPVQVLKTDRSRVEHAFIQPGEEGIRGFAQPATRSWFAWGGAVGVNSPFYISAPNYVFMNPFIPETIQTNQLGSFFLPDNKQFKTSAIKFSYDSLYGPERDRPGAVAPVSLRTYEKDPITSVVMGYIKDERTCSAEFTLSVVNASEAMLTFTKFELQKPNSPPLNVRLTPLSVRTVGQALTTFTTTQENVYPKRGGTFPEQFESFLSSVLDVNLPPVFSIGEFLMKFHVINDINPGTEQDVGFIKTMASDSTITALKVNTAEKRDTVILDFKAPIKVEKVGRVIHIQIKLVVEPKRNNMYVAKLKMDEINVLPPELKEYVVPKHEYVSGFKEKEFSGINGRLVSSDGSSLSTFVERACRGMITTDDLYRTQGGIEYTRNGLPVPKNSQRIPQSMRIKELWDALAQRPYVKAYAIALGSSLINTAGLRGDVKSAYSDICRTNFPYASNGSLPKIGSPITTSYGLKALASLFVESVEGATPQLKDNDKYREFRSRFREYYEFKKDDKPPPSMDQITRVPLTPCRGHEGARIKLDETIIGKLRFHVSKLVEIQEGHVRNAMGLLFQLFDQGSVTRGEFKTSVYVQNEGMAAVEAIGRKTRDTLMDYYMACEKINRDALRDIHEYLKRNEKDAAKLFEQVVS